jgi:hypothetical protein
MPTEQRSQVHWAPTPARVVWWLPGALILLLLLATTGCTAGQPPQQLRWDLRQSHTKADVGWQNQLSAHSVPHADVIILLPGGHTFVGQGVEVFLSACQDQNQVCYVEIHLYPEETIDEAYRHAKQIAQAWHFQTDDLERWYQDVLAGRQRGIKDQDELLNGVEGGAGGPALVPGGPTAALGMVYSFDEQRPVLLVFTFDWTGTCPTC